jgi:hypothetical protein
MPTTTQKKAVQPKQSKSGARETAASARKRTGRDSGGAGAAESDAKNGRQRAAAETIGTSAPKLSPAKPESKQKPEEAIARKRAKQVSTEEEPESGSVQR